MSDDDATKALEKALENIDVVESETDIFIPKQQILNGMPRLITRFDMYTHWKLVGHFPDDIASSGFMPRQKIKCPIYWDNEMRKDVTFNNYLCSCGKLFIFKAKFQKDSNGREYACLDSNYGVCPCDTCNFWAEGIGCRVKLSD